MKVNLRTRNMTNQTRKPTHPGVFFKKEVLEPRFISVHKAAVELGITYTILCLFIDGVINCNSIIADKLAEYTGTSADVWLNMQSNYDKHIWGN